MSRSPGTPYQRHLMRYAVLGRWVMFGDGNGTYTIVEEDGTEAGRVVARRVSRSDARRILDAITPKERA